MTENEKDLEEQEIITLKDDEGNEFDYILFDALEVDDKRYVILLPAEVDYEEVPEEEEVEVEIMRVEVDENGDEVLIFIEEDDEWESVADAWQELQDDEE